MTLVVYASMTVGTLVDEFDNRTNLSGAFVGGLLLAAVTSLPEFITSITSTVVYNEPGLAFGNIFGSNIFNLVILAVMDIIFVRKIVYTKITEIDKANKLSILIYFIILIPFITNILLGNGILNIDIDNKFFNIVQNAEILGFSLLSIAILVIYFISAKTLSEGDDVESEDNTEGKFSKYSMKVVTLLFIFWAGVLVAASYFITGTTNEIASLTGLSASFAGALFLGVATSLPELTTCYTLIKLNNYEAAAGGIVGSNIFNFTIIAVVDLFVKDNIIDLIVNDPTVSQNELTLLILGLINSIILMLALMRKKKFGRKIVYLVPSVLIITNYLFYLVISFV
ncbi:sodium:calcium antiporter [Mycoplasmatota bacterium]|nr:sodium:calcium antiporter [Mycoplasmatota bacterium]